VSASEAITHGVRVRVTPEYSSGHSRPESAQWFYLYTVRIENQGDKTVQLVSRHWIITDANGKVEEVQGPGVVGRQPVLAPGESFEYTSGCPLSTPFGSMHGTYKMVLESGDSFNATIAPFALSQPGAVQ
jgi:ApaG protein